MAYSKRPAGRVRDALKNTPGVTERHMFGGIAFMLDGNMCCGVIGDRLMVRVGPEDSDG
jgi:TfoX/Sxy family transcriptional regulator of competence genes